jgi:hypothetical protein
MTRRNLLQLCQGEGRRTAATKLTGAGPGRSDGSAKLKTVQISCHDAKNTTLTSTQLQNSFLASNLIARFLAAKIVQIFGMD